MPDGGAHHGRIGPNAVLQLLPGMEARLGRRRTARLLRAAGYPAPPSDAAMIDEAGVARLHAVLRATLGAEASPLLAEAGRRTASYVMAHRIPAPARGLLRALPGPLAAPLLARAIARHAWTFAGSGRFDILGHAPLTFEIAANPLATGPRCIWHESVFSTLFQSLAGRSYHAVETECRGLGAPACRFEIRR
ncbi:bacteriochlorophyll 4-vinyl reductase [Halovulum dunhuangense]|uniref:Bacteriochlorophyll 4-vinyl reductase n=1 Tax=Halovulum dunhuangense TaxID=1505036 RepID=A0A849L687_9RHOB|nr:bacteriochlorophyll 4-vinyl reductase [Halovulum dunhuangense]NNU81945.1 bacteriochlorophyll 4-vinyl reductase [Halovulum dunhuangense]